MSWLKRIFKSPTKETTEAIRERGSKTMKLIEPSELDILRTKAEAWDELLKTHGTFLRKNQIIK